MRPRCDYIRRRVLTERSDADGGNPHHARSKNYADSIPPQDAVIVQRLQRAGGNNCSAKPRHRSLGGRPTTEGGFVPDRPQSMESRIQRRAVRAAAQRRPLLAGLGPLAEGSDGGGSIRGPASNCGVVGLKPVARTNNLCAA